jgi:hypothetical protein
LVGEAFMPDAFCASLPAFNSRTAGQRIGHECLSYEKRLPTAWAGFRTIVIFEALPWMY